MFLFLISMLKSFTNKLTDVDARTVLVISLIADKTAIKTVRCLLFFFLVNYLCFRFLMFCLVVYEYIY